MLLTKTKYGLGIVLVNKLLYYDEKNKIQYQKLGMSEYFKF